MGIDFKQQRYCDECGRIGLDIKRIHAGNDYCASCYARVFVSKPCTVCAGPARVHRNDSEPARCGRCQRATRTCMRCGVLTPQAGMKVGDAVACASCAPHFREARHCDGCGRLSSRLSSAPKFGITMRLCERCRGHLDHATCSACSRYRRVAGFDGEKPLCPHCVVDPKNHHACPECSAPVAGGGKGACRACLNKRRLRSDGQLQAVTLSMPWARELWERFVSQRSTARSARAPGFVTHSLRSLSFFQLLETRLPDGVLTPERILGSFTTAELRKHLLASRFVLAPMEVDKTALAESALEHRCRTILEAADGLGHGALLREYAASLAGRAARTRCSYLSVADKLCRSLSKWALEDLNQALLERFIAGTPGARASLFPWVSYCRKHAGRDWQVPALKESAGARHLSADLRTFRRQLADLGRKPDERILTTELLSLLAVALSVPIDRLTRCWAQGKLTERADAIQVGRFATLHTDHPLHRFAALLRLRKPALAN